MRQWPASTSVLPATHGSPSNPTRRSRSDPDSFYGQTPGFAGMGRFVAKPMVAARSVGRRTDCKEKSLRSAIKRTREIGALACLSSCK